ncbi:MAG: FecR domain-containing protein [Deltaproteobacteria bacterium]|nr:FecR domain-containing protein [Deltaproteobacteria bacterium]
MSRRTIAIVVAGAVVVVAAAVLAVRSLGTTSRYQAPAPATDAAPAPEVAAQAPADAAPPPPAARVETVEGAVTVRRAGSESAVRPGATLEADDILTTAADGRAVVRVDEETSVVLEAGTAVTWGAITDSLSSVQLDRGFLSASTGDQGGRVFRVQALDRTANVEASAGAFDVAGDGEQVAVASSSGEVTVESGGERVRVGSGSYTTVRRGERPRTPQQLPGSVVAEMFWPGDATGEDGSRLVAERSVVVRGRIGGGLSGVLTIRNESTGQTVRVVTRPDGSFDTTLALAEDQDNELVVGGTAMGGPAIEEQRAVVAQDSTPPPLTVRIQ